ncbi:coiled-coil domain-containing protein 134-like [Nylanderia fulva]|uniref:coiled-coil domain-containing protein 134-like n=1 Tax=Nylanderia fulva TaxID=613905 RepID=UPI0010FB2DC7|nr:coiled-coil domain-containing protein 134-like [Nylanderia fulva]
MLQSRIHRRIFVHVVAVLVLIIMTHAQVENGGPITGEPQKGAEFKSDEKLFKKLFIERRKDHVEAIQTLLKIDNYERLYKMITMLAEKVIEIIQSSKNIIEKAGFVPNNNSFPKDTNVKDALSSVLENTALFGDIILHLPDITHRILKTQQGWNPTIHWSLNFTNQMRHLLNKSTITMIRLVEQELNITERDPNYLNPYKSSTRTGYQHQDTAEKKKPVKKEKRKKGPQIAKIEL